MKESKQIADEFKAELKALLEKYNAQIEAQKDTFTDNLLIDVYIQEKWNDKKLAWESAEIEFSEFINSETI